MDEGTNSGAAVAARRPATSVATVIAVALAAVAIGGGGTWLLTQRGRGGEEDRTVDTSSAPKYLIHLEGFTVNLADPEETHFLRVTIDLGIDRLPEGSDREKPSAKLPVARIRDVILSVLTVCKADALLTPQGKAQLKKNLVDALTRSVPELGVREVYFTEFLVQR